MKQTVFLIAMMAFCTFRSFFDPFWAVLMYYGLSVLRPQSIWNWALPTGVRWSFFAAVLAIVVTIAHAKPLRYKAAQGPFVVMVLLFGLCLAGSCLFAIDQDIAVTAGWEYAKILIMLVIGCMVVTEARHVRYLGYIFFLCLTYLVYEINSMYLFQRQLVIYHRGYGGMDNNGAGLMLAMVIPFCYYFFRAERRWWRWGYLLCALPAVHAVMLSYSRGAMVSAILAACGMLLAGARRGFWRTACIAAVLCCLVLAMAGPEVRKRFLSIGNVRHDPSARSKFESWRAGWEIAKTYPLFGAGLRNSNLLTKEYGADFEGRTIHNVYIQIAADAGTVAAVVYAALLGSSLWWLHRTARLLRDQQDHPERRWLYCICRASFWSLVTFCIGGMFLSLETFELSHLLMLIGAVAPSVRIQQAQTGEVPIKQLRRLDHQPQEIGAWLGSARQGKRTGRLSPAECDGLGSDLGSQGVSAQRQ